MIALHCIAGIGRTGTMASIYMYHVWNRTGVVPCHFKLNSKKISMKEIILYIKLKRGRSITPYQFCKLLEYEANYESSKTGKDCLVVTPVGRLRSNSSGKPTESNLLKLKKARPMGNYSDRKINKREFNIMVNSKFTPSCGGQMKLAQSVVLNPTRDYTVRIQGRSLKTSNQNSGVFEKIDSRKPLTRSAMLTPKNRQMVQNSGRRRLQQYSSKKVRSVRGGGEGRQKQVYTPDARGYASGKEMFFRYHPRGGQGSKQLEGKGGGLGSGKNGQDRVNKVPKISIFDTDSGGKERRKYKPNNFANLRRKPRDLKQNLDSNNGSKSRMKPSKDDMYGKTNKELEEEWERKNKGGTGVWGEISNSVMSWFKK